MAPARWTVVASSRRKFRVAKMSILELQIHYISKATIHNSIDQDACLITLTPWQLGAC
jgi:hypothetical protein